jgi:hypothetical protein
MSLLLKKDYNVNYIGYLHILARNKINLIWFLFFCCVSFITCFIVISRLIHTHVIFPIVIHLISFNIILFINSIYIVLFKKTKRVFLLISSLSVFLVVDLLYLLQSSNILEAFYIPFVGNDVPKTLLLFVVTLFVMDTIGFKK